MRDPDRQERILKLIGAIWCAYPDLRLCQLIGNCFAPGDHYYTDDLELEKALIFTYYSKRKEDTSDTLASVQE